MGEVRPFRRDRVPARPSGAGNVGSGRGFDGDELAALITRTARGDTDAFATLYDALAGAVYGLVLRVLRDSAQSEEVTQEVLVDVWRHAARYEPARGSVQAWVLTMAHRRAVDRVRSAQASSNREQRVGRSATERPYDEVSEAVQHRMEVEQVRRALSLLTDLQREAVTLAYYGGYTQGQVAQLLGVPLGTVKTRLRDGLIRLRDEMGVHT